LWSSGDTTESFGGLSRKVVQSKEVQSFGSFFDLMFFFETAVHFPILAPDFSSYFFGAASFVEFPDLLT
jgi:hypothetical protein